MPRKFTRKLIDKKGNIWCVEIPFDVDPESVEDILLGAHDGIVKLQGYQLAGSATYQLPADNSDIHDGAKRFSFHKKLDVSGYDQEEFSKAIQGMIERARQSKIGVPRVTEFEGKKIKEDVRGPYIDWEVPCHICETPIPGTRRLSMSDGFYTRAQMFNADDPAVVKYRPGSRLRVCGTCAPKLLTPQEAGMPYPTVEEVASVVSEVDLPVELPPTAVDITEPEKPKVKRNKDCLDELLELADPKRDTDPMFLKGAVYGMLRALKTKGE